MDFEIESVVIPPRLSRRLRVPMPGPAITPDRGIMFDTASFGAQNGDYLPIIHFILLSLLLAATSCHK